MKRQWRFLLSVVLVCLVDGPAFAQQRKQIPDADVINKSIKAVGYEVGAGSTKMVFIGTTAAPNASGEARVDAKTNGTAIELRVKGMPQPTSLGAEFLTYVLWAITPDGSTSNLGEIPLDKIGEGKLNTSTRSQTFAMIVTAEPYFAVSLPSEVVVLENDTTKSTRGKIFPDNSYRLMKQSQYAKLGNPLALTPDLKNVPLAMYEARNAVDIAKAQGAPQYAPDAFAKATGSLQVAENNLAAKADRAQIITSARQTIQFAEDARALTAQRQEAERIQKEKDAAAAAAAAQAQKEAEARAAGEAQRQAELNAAKQAQMQAEADAAAARAKADADAAAAKAKSDADAAAARAKAELDAQAAASQAREEAAKEEADRARAAEAALRAQLLQQLNSVLQTSDTPRGLVVNMADVLFAFGRYNLKPDAQLKLAKLAGIIQAHPGLHLAIEGHTDNIGSDEANMKLSQQRADAVRDFLTQQGLPPDILTSEGLGKADPVADNSSSEGRQKNRRVEIIVSGEVIGQKIG
jgi:outer membrane protein OmpA-like peptidoglycan-associated protein